MRAYIVLIHAFAAGVLGYTYGTSLRVATHEARFDVLENQYNMIESKLDYLLTQPYKPEKPVQRLEHHI